MVGWPSAYEVIYHSGGTLGFFTSQRYVPREELSVVVFTNTDTGSSERLAMNIARAVLHLPPLP